MTLAPLAMTALTTDDAKTIGAVVVVGFAVLAIAAAWLMKTIVQKVILAVVLGGLAVGAWSQRAAVDDCVAEISASVGDGEAATCSFLGIEVDVPVDLVP
jgi:hypothetical protein